MFVVVKLLKANLWTYEKIKSFRVFNSIILIKCDEVSFCHFKLVSLLFMDVSLRKKPEKLSYLSLKLLSNSFEFWIFCREETFLFLKNVVPEFHLKSETIIIIVNCFIRQFKRIQFKSQVIIYIFIPKLKQFNYSHLILIKLDKIVSVCKVNDFEHANRWLVFVNFEYFYLLNLIQYKIESQKSSKE